MTFQWLQKKTKMEDLLDALKLRLFKPLQRKNALLCQLQVTFVDLWTAYSDQCVTNGHKLTTTLFTPQSQWLLGKNDTRRTHYQPLFLNPPSITTQLPCCWTLTSLDGPLYDCSNRSRGNGIHQWQLPHSGWTGVCWGSGGVKYRDHMWRTTPGRNVSPGS